MRTLILVFLISLVIPLASSAQTCPRDAIQRATESTNSIQTRMLAVKGSSDGMDYSFTPTTGELIRSMKESLATVINEYMACATESISNPKVIESDLAKLLDANKPAPPSQTLTESTPMPSDHVYGDALQIDVTRPDASLDLIAVQTSFSVGCGNDTMLLIYEWKHDAWQRALRWQSGDYKEVSGAFGDFFNFVVLRRKESGQWLVAVAHGMPWCTSRWSGYDLDLIQPSGTGESQHVLVHRNSTYVRFDVDPTMKLELGGFELRLQTGQLDLEYMTRLGIYRYRVIGDSLQRVQPIALNGKDFVDEWLQSDWSDAIHWSATTHLGDLQNVHAEVAKRIAPKSGDDAVLSYGPVRACSGDPKHFQVEFDRDPGKPTYFQIEQGENSFTMLDASPTPNSHCKGADLMQKQ
jgi:hypothetical protein